ncbi:methyltransferase domain-containing protein [Stachybotrys elegans]|uniref:Methyltransferase domain-containing protein n=1 Tax=Stachybotrys elegans TaxID=80388 RepID=A0A8K0WQT2_9HYPO|nr:methyltransferase domain-containing protein [Stachybotrys elegans]
MLPDKSLPYTGDFSSGEEYVEELLDFATSSDLFQILCGGVHILDSFTMEIGHFTGLPSEWHNYLLSTDIMRILDLFFRDDLETVVPEPEGGPPESLMQYVRTIRRLALGRKYTPSKAKLPALTRLVSVGMKPKKIHEVTNFADYVDRLSGDVTRRTGQTITHFVDFGSGQNYLGRALASKPYNRHVIAVEGRDTNVVAARDLDLKSGLAITPTVRRNKKLWMKILNIVGPEGRNDPNAMAEAIKQVSKEDGADFRPMIELGVVYGADDGGMIHYISGRLDSGDLSDVIAQAEETEMKQGNKEELKMMAVSIHSCGNLSHYGIRSLLLNRNIRAVAIVGCCYNLVTEKLGPPTYKHTFLRPTLQALNGRVFQESHKRDPQGFPMSRKFSTYKDEGVRLNITARMMACHAPENWTREESEDFFTRHFYRALLQKIFLDRGVVQKVRHRDPNDPRSQEEEDKEVADTPFDSSTNPIIIGSLRKPCYVSFKTYVRGAIEKLTTSGEFKKYTEVMQEKMADMSDEEIDEYETRYQGRKKEICVMWSLMGFSATVVESLMAADRWMFLKESDQVEEAWVETVFDYKQSPRNLVVVGVKKADAA